MSRSCHSATFSSAGITAERTSRASPVRFSVRIGLRLCGIDDEPFCPASNGSSASRTSVRCKWRISTARRSIDEATTASALRSRRVRRSRGMTWLEIGSGRRPSLSATCASTLGSTLAKVPTGPEIAQVATLEDRAIARALAGAHELGEVASQLEAECGGLGVDAVAAPDCRGQPMLESATLQGREHQFDILQEEVGSPGQLDGESGVVYVGGSHALVQEARLRGRRSR